MTSITASYAPATPILAGKPAYDVTAALFGLAAVLLVVVGFVTASAGTLVAAVPVMVAGIAAFIKAGIDEMQV